MSSLVFPLIYVIIADYKRKCISSFGMFRSHFLSLQSLVALAYVVIEWHAVIIKGVRIIRLLKKIIKESVSSTRL